MATIKGDVKRANGVAGQVSWTALVGYEGEPDLYVSFVGSVYGGPVVMVADARQTFVYEPSRFGDFAKDGAAWVRRFFGN